MGPVHLSNDQLVRLKRVHHTAVSTLLWRDLDGTKARLQRAAGVEEGEGPLMYLGPHSPWAYKYETRGEWLPVFLLFYSYFLCCFILLCVLRPHHVLVWCLFLVFPPCAVSMRVCCAYVVHT